MSDTAGVWKHTKIEANITPLSRYRKTEDAADYHRKVNGASKIHLNSLQKWLACRRPMQFDGRIRKKERKKAPVWKRKESAGGGEYINSDVSKLRASW